MQANKRGDFFQRHIQQQFPGSFHREAYPPAQADLRSIGPRAARAVQGGEQRDAGLQCAGFREACSQTYQPVWLADQASLFGEFSQRRFLWSLIGVYKAAYRFVEEASNSMAKRLYQNDSSLKHGKDGCARDERVRMNPRFNHQIVWNFVAGFIGNVVGVYQKPGILKYGATLLQ